jgi:hypothetical protein
MRFDGGCAPGRDRTRAGAAQQQGRSGVGVLRRSWRPTSGPRSPTATSTGSSSASSSPAGYGPRRSNTWCETPSGVEIGRLDLAYPPEKVGLELDSRKHHLTSSAFEHDRVRQNRFEIAGWLILRYTWLHYTRTPQQLLNDVSAALTARRVT